MVHLASAAYGISLDVGLSETLFLSSKLIYSLGGTWL
jgi:hypothetical protein